MTNEETLTDEDRTAVNITLQQVAEELKQQEEEHTFFTSLDQLGDTHGQT